MPPKTDDVKTTVPQDTHRTCRICSKRVPVSEHCPACGDLPKADDPDQRQAREERA